jgi:anti-sigma factor RsiW
MTSCKDIKALLPAYSDGELSERDGQLVAGHVAVCSDCSSLLADLRKTQLLLGGLEEVEPPPWLAQKIMAHVRDEADKEPALFKRLFYPLRVKIPLQAFATVMIAGLILFLYKGVNPPYEAARTPDQALYEKLQEKPEASSAGKVPGPPPAPKSPAPVPEAAPPSPPAPASPDFGTRQSEEKELVLRSAPVPAPAVPDSAVRQREMEEAHKQAFSAKRAAGLTAATPVEVTLQVSDLESAAGEVEDLLRETGARNVKRESHDGSESVTGELQREKIGPLVEQLDDIGDARPARPDLPPGNVAIRIRVVPDDAR